MINFFRKIRQQLADDNKPLKYMRYAVGEIILVMIGILLALQVNNWSESNKIETAEIKYLERMKLDLTKDTLYYNQKIEQCIKGIEWNTKAIQIAYYQQNNLKEFQELLDLTYYYSPQFTIQNGTYIEMINAGALNIIQNEELKIAIIELYRKSNEADKHISEFNEFSVQILVDQNAGNPISKYLAYPWIRELFNDEKMVNNSDWKFINDPTSIEFRSLENCSLIYLSKFKTLQPYYIDLKSKSKSIIEIITEELKSRE